MIGLIDVIILCASGILMLILEGIVYRTKLGTAMRAVSFSTETAALMGIDVDRAYRIAFGGAGAEFGFASAISVVLFIVTAVLAGIQFRYTKAL